MSGDEGQSTPSPEGASPTFRYDAAVASFNAGRHQAAGRDFEALLRDPALPDDLRDNCMYWLGESHYARRQWLDALACFQKVLEHVQSNKEEDARLKIALCWLNLGDTGRACREARALVERFPDCEAAPRARRLLERCPRSD